MITVNNLKQTNSFIRFLIVGVVNTIVGLSIMFILLNLFHCTYWLATFIGNCIGAMVSYKLNRSFTFNSRVKGSEGIPKFFLVILCCYVFSYSIGKITAEGIHLFSQSLSILSKDELAVLIGTVVYTLANYLGQKSFVFQRLSEEKGK